MVSGDGVVVLLAFITGIFGIFALGCYCYRNSRLYYRRQLQEQQQQQQQQQHRVSATVEVSTRRRSRARSMTDQSFVDGEGAIDTFISMSILSGHQQTYPDCPPPPYESAITDQWESREMTSNFAIDGIIPVTADPRASTTEDVLPPPYTPT